MKSELIHLLQKLKSAHPDFHSLIIHPNGVAYAVCSHANPIPFQSLAALEQYAWPPEETQSSVLSTQPSFETAGPAVITPIDQLLSTAASL